MNTCSHSYQKTCSHSYQKTCEHTHLLPACVTRPPYMTTPTCCGLRIFGVKSRDNTDATDGRGTHGECFYHLTHSSSVDDADLRGQQRVNKTVLTPPSSVALWRTRDPLAPPPWLPRSCVNGLIPSMPPIWPHPQHASHLATPMEHTKGWAPL